MGLALAVLLFLGMQTTIGIRILKPLVETPDDTGNAHGVGLSTSAGRLCLPVCNQRLFRRLVIAVVWPGALLWEPIFQWQKQMPLSPGLQRFSSKWRRLFLILVRRLRSSHTVVGD